MLFDFHFLFCQYFSKISVLHWRIDISFCLSLLCFCAHQACLHIPVLLWSLIVNLQENYRMGGSFVWPTVAKVAEYRKKVRKAILDVIDNTPLELPVTQESKWVRWTNNNNNSNNNNNNRIIIIIIIIIIIFIEGAQLAKAVFSGALINDWTVNSEPLLRDLEACREFMTGYSWQNLSWGMYCIEDIIYMVARRWILFFLGESNILRTCRASVWNIVFHHKKIKFISSSHWVIFFLLCIHFSFSHSLHKLYHELL